MVKTGDLANKRKAKDEMEDLEAVNLAADWADISQGLRKDLGHQLHSQWIKPIQLGKIDPETGTLDLFLPTEFSANWVKDRFADRLSLAWKIARSEVRRVAISVHPGRRQVADLLFAKATERGMTLVLVTHDPALANRCSRQIAMRSGRIESGQILAVSA